MNNDEIMMLAKKHHITNAYEYGSGVSDEDVIAFFNAASQTKQAELTNQEIQEVYSKQHEIPCNILGFARAILRKAQEPLGEPFEKVLHDNLWNLLEESNGKAQEK